MRAGSRRRLAILAAAAVGSVVPSFVTSAATYTWTAGGGSTYSWGLASNWGGTVPDFGDDIVFASGGASANLNVVSRTVGSINFMRATGFTINVSGASLTIQKGIGVAAASTFTIGARSSSMAPIPGTSSRTGRSSSMAESPAMDR